jgi:hypothetical protein
MAPSERRLMTTQLNDAALDDTLKVIGAAIGNPMLPQQVKALYAVIDAAEGRGFRRGFESGYKACEEESTPGAWTEDRRVDEDEEYSIACAASALEDRFATLPSCVVNVVKLEDTF